ncbi:calcium ATPase [Fistulina hepatica ATCC 64428]|uniref:Calcium ATPase n=1 Tax=Fistulina hepatica ATCC 64428 TaxID=1128425 RepID=A0A0D7AAX3_9AGAR|nr:calcium ATPase [Fistulina hepatica ATCC 64428]
MHHLVKRSTRPTIDGEKDLYGIRADGPRYAYLAKTKGKEHAQLPSPDKEARTADQSGSHNGEEKKKEERPGEGPLRRKDLPEILAELYASAADYTLPVPFEHLATDVTLVGVVGIEDPLREGVREAVRKCSRMCTGDSVPADEDKKILIETLEFIGEVVGVMYRRWHQRRSCSEGSLSDIFLWTTILLQFYKAMIWGCCVNDSVCKFLQFQLCANVTVVVIMFMSAVASTKEETVVSTVQLLWINIIMDTFAAFAFATDPASEASLDRKPERKTVPLFTVHIVPAHQTIIFVIFHFLDNSILGLDDRKDSNSVTQTLAFNTFLPYFFGTILTEIMAQIIIVFVGGSTFEVTKIGVREWSASLALGVVSFSLGAIVRQPVGRFRPFLISSAFLEENKRCRQQVQRQNQGKGSSMARLSESVTVQKLLPTCVVGAFALRTIDKSCRQRLDSDELIPLCVSIHFLISTMIMSMAPTLMASAVAAGQSWMRHGSIANLIGADPFISPAALWEGKIQVDPDTDRSDDAYRRYGKQAASV